MSEIKLPPQESARDTSNWEGKVFTAPVASSVDKIKKKQKQREMILNAPERKRKRTPSNPDIARIKK